MPRTQFHVVTGSADPVIHDSGLPFDPEIYEMGVEKLTEFLIRVVSISDSNTPDTVEDTAAHDDFDIDQDESCITIPEDSGTTIGAVAHATPHSFDTSILLDEVQDKNFIVYTSISCGEDVALGASVRVGGGIVSEIKIRIDNLVDGEDNVFKNISPHARNISRATTMLHQTVAQAYGRTITSSASAYDYVATRHIEIGGHYNVYQTLTQRDWSDIRGVTEQTVSNNVSEAQSDMTNLSTESSYSVEGVHTPRPSLQEINPDEKVGFLHLV